MKILGIGESVIDNVLITRQRMGDTIMASQKHVGGPIPSALILLSRLDMDCTLITSLGRDTDALIIKKVLKKEKVHLIPHLKNHTKVNTILVNAPTGSREKQRGNIIHKPIQTISKKLLQQFDLVIMDRHEKELFYDVLKKKSPHTKIIVDTSIEVSDFTLDMLKHAEFPIVPIEALTKISTKKNLLSSLKHLQNHCRKPVIVTVGELGSILFDKGKMKIIPPLAVKSVDVTGAGDIFRGAFAFGILKKWTIEETIQFANLVAGLQCTRMGNVAAIPSKEQIEFCRNLIIQKKSVKKTMVNNYFLNLL